MLHSTFSTGKQLSRALHNFLFLHTDNFAATMDGVFFNTDVLIINPGEAQNIFYVLHCGSKSQIEVPVSHKGLALTLKKFPLPKRLACVVRI